MDGTNSYAYLIHLYIHSLESKNLAHRLWIWPPLAYRESQIVLQSNCSNLLTYEKFMMIQITIQY